MSERDWTINNLRTGREIGKTARGEQVFFEYARRLKENGVNFYAVIGRTRTSGFREFVQRIRSLGVNVEYSSDVRADVLILLGEEE